MLKLGEKGAIVQRDNETYAVAPHIPCGVATPQLLRKLADAAEKYGAKAIKITGATRIALVGIREEDVDKIWRDLDMVPGRAVGLCIRSIRACPGTTFCKLGQQDALGVGLKLDSLYHGMELPGKCKMAVSGCHLNCAESPVRDIGLVGKTNGWTLLIGGNVASDPRIAQEVAAGLDDTQALEAVARVVAYYQKNAKKGERIGKTIERVGIQVFKDAVAG